MELSELKATWEMLGQVLERGNRLSAEMLRRQKLDAAQKSLRPLKLNQTFQILFGVFFIFLAALLWATKPTAVSVILSGVIVQVYGIGCILTAGLVFSSLNHIDYAGSVVNAQTGLTKVRRTYGISVLVAGLSWWFLWVPVLMLLAGLAHVNLYANAPSVIWIGVMIGVVGLAGTYWIYLYSVKSDNVQLRRFAERATFGRSLMSALEQLDEIRGFEKETASVSL
jgi:hypothetical protein